MRCAHSPVDAVNVWRYRRLPLITGRWRSVSVAWRTARVRVEVAVAGSRSGWDAVTCTDSRLPRSASSGRYVAAVAPAIGVPARSHLNVYVDSAGSHVPGEAVNSPL